MRNRISTAKNVAQLGAHVVTSESYHTPLHVDCDACESSRITAVSPALLAHEEFSLASETWISVHSRYICEETTKDYRKCIKALLKFFNGMILKDIHIGNVREYQQFRAHTKRVNKECVCLGLILQEANLWAPIAAKYKPLKLPKSDKGRRMTWAEEDRLKKVVLDNANRKQWALAGNCLLVMANTSFGFKELKYLRRRDVQMDERLISLEVSAKNDGRYRTIPLNGTAFDAMTYLIARWEKIGGSDPEQFILPHRAHIAGAKWDFYTPMGSIKNAHKKIMAAADIKNFRIYDCRHHAISKWLGNPKVPPQVADEMAGHISQAMRRRYSHQLIESMRQAVEAMESPKKSA